MNITIALAVAKLFRLILRKIFRSNGETIPGRLLLKLNKNAISILSLNRIVLLVSGTNGKTSTTKFIADSARDFGSVATSDTGSNLKWGIANSLISKSKFAILEVDELFLPEVYIQTKPMVVLLLNLSRDQLHRMHEVKRVADAWFNIVKNSESTFVIDVDDPFLNYATSSVRNVVTISFGGRKHKDSSVCPRCGEYLLWRGGIYDCKCGLTNRNAQYTFKSQSADSRNFQLSKIAMELIGIKHKAIIDLKRTSELELNSRKIELYLTKNPSSWEEVLKNISSENIIIVLNSEQEDGLDTSWIWDINFQILSGRTVVVTGDRALDMAYRLHIAGVEVKITRNFTTAVDSFIENSHIEALLSYSAFFQLERK